MMRQSRLIRSALLAALPALVLAGGASAQDRSPGLLDNLFSRGQGQAQSPPGPAPQSDAADPSDMSVRLDRIENALRQLTGTVEQLQYRNQQLEAQIGRMQNMPGPGQPPAQVTTPVLPNGPGLPPAPSPSGRRSDVFDPSQNPNAPGAPRTLGSLSANAAVAAPGQPDDQQIGAPGGRDAGTPLDLSTLSANPPPLPPSLPPRVAAGGEPAAPVSAANPVSAAPIQQADIASNKSTLPPVMRPAVAPAVPGAKLATLPPSASPQDEYDMAYGYVLHKDYGLAEQAFRDFLRKYPNERLQPDAQYWLGESLYQRQRYRDAAESFLAVSTKYEHAGKAPDSLLRLGQSLAALKQKEAACATLSEVNRKYPKASSAVKRGVAEEIKRAHC